MGQIMIWPTSWWVLHPIPQNGDAGGVRPAVVVAVTFVVVTFATAANGIELPKGLAALADWHGLTMCRCIDVPKLCVGTNT